MADELTTSKLKVLSDNFQQIMEPLVKSLEAYSEICINMHKQISIIFSPIIREIQTFKEFGWDDEYKAIIERCGKLGWSFSRDMDIGTPRDLVKLTNNQIDKFFYSYFTENNNAELKETFARLQNKCYCKNPKRLTEAIQSFNAHRYNAVAPLLFSIIDYLISEVDNSNSYKTKLSKYEIKIKSDEGMILYHLVLFSALYHLEIMFNTPKYKDTPETPMINRHGIMHGTSTHDVSRKECIQLFNTLDALVLTINIIEMHKY